jgi:hypothetical protein
MLVPSSSHTATSWGDGVLEPDVILAVAIEVSRTSNQPVGTGGRAGKAAGDQAESVHLPQVDVTVAGVLEQDVALAVAVAVIADAMRKVLDCEPALGKADELHFMDRIGAIAARHAVDDRDTSRRPEDRVEWRRYGKRFARVVPQPKDLGLKSSGCSPVRNVRPLHGRRIIDWSRSQLTAKLNPQVRAAPVHHHSTYSCNLFRIRPKSERASKIIGKRTQYAMPRP